MGEKGAANHKTAGRLMPPEKFKLSVSARGVLYVLIPAIIQILCLCGLMLLLQQENEVGNHESHSKELISRANWMCVLVSASVAGRLAYLESGGRQAQDLCRNALRQLPDDVKALKDSVKDEPALANLVDKAQPLLDRLAKSLTEADDSPPQKQIAKIISVSEDTWPQLMVLRRKLVRGDKALDSEVYKTAPLKRTMARDVIALLILFTVASALIVIYRFGKTIAQRIAVTSDNTARLSQGLALHPPIGGSDEIAQLDHAFHNMAQELAHAQQLRQEYISMISHDIRTPLTSVYGSIEYLDSGYGGELNDKGAGMTERALRNLERVLAMINSLLLVEQLESGMTTFLLIDASLQSIVRSAIDSVHDLSQKQNVRIESKVDEIEVVADEQRTAQVLINLLGNALKFSPENSTIKITSELREDMVEVKVIDQGRGIPKDAVDKIFNRFQQVQRSDAEVRSGVGLGLAICKAIIQGQGGTIGVASELGAGSTFWFTLKKSAVYED